MINLALAVLVAAIIGALFGFVGTAAGMPGFAQSTLFVFLALLVVALARSLAPVSIAGKRRGKGYDFDDH